MITLIIKGNRDQAESAVLNRKIIAALVQEDENEVILLVDNRYQATIYQWFIEDINDDTFKPGSLLWYSHSNLLPIKEEVTMS